MGGPDGCPAHIQRGGIPMANYDPKIIEEFAGRLYQQADAMLYKYTLWGIALGIVPGILPYLTRGMASNSLLIFGAIIGGFLGWQVGRAKSLELRVRAQSILVQKQIEENTRPR